MLLPQISRCILAIPNGIKDVTHFCSNRVVLEKPTVASTRETLVAPESTPKVNETEKLWHYKDPSEKIQGPFSMAQLRKWSKNGYFPAGLKIWRKSDKEDDAVVLNDARTVGRRDIANFPSPTPNKGTTGWTGGQTGSHAGPSRNEGLQSPTPNSAHVVGASVSPLVPSGNKEANYFGSSRWVAPPNNSMTPQMVQSVSGQNPQGWSGGPPQNLQPNLQPNMPQEQWGQFPFPVTQLNMQQVQLQLQPPQPTQSNVNWGAMVLTPNMGWVAPNWYSNKCTSSRLRKDMGFGKDMAITFVLLRVIKE
ncbi:zinc finger CCCH domain-containing protein 19-like protein [Tanacetum coccineum]